MPGRSDSAAGSVEALLDEAARLQARGALSDAALKLDEVLLCDPSHLGALVRYLLLALLGGNAQLALALGQRAVTAHPESAVAHHFLGLAQHRASRLADAIASLERALSLDPDYFDACLNLGNMRLDSGDAQAALDRYRQALTLVPASAAAHNNIGNAYRELRQPDAALRAYRRAVELDAVHVQAHNNVGNMLKDMGDAEGAIAAFRRAIELAPNRPDLWSNLLLALNCSDRVSATQIDAEHRRFGAHFRALLPPLLRSSTPPLEGRRLRVGYVSSDFRRHAVATFFLPLLEAHDRNRIETFCYYNGLRADETTERVRAVADHFVPIAGMSDPQLAQAVRGDGIDVLVDLNGHTAYNRLPLFFLRPAPVQVTWLGYLCSSGMAEIDHRLSDPFADPVGMTDRLHAETLWRLPSTLWCYRAYDEAPAVSLLPSQAAGHVTFGCLNNPGKASPTSLSLWAAILQAVPASRLLLLTSPHAERVAEIDAFFETRGVDRQRIEQVARAPLAEYLGTYHRVDIALDSWPYSGGTTTCDALWMGVPVVTLAGDRSFARSGASILTNVGLPELVTQSREDYVGAAVALASERERMRELRETLRARMQASPLMDAARFARDFEAALATMRERMLSARPGIPPP